MKKEITLIIDKKDAGKRLDDFLKERYHWLNDKKIKENIKSRVITHSSGSTRINKILKKHDIVKIAWEIKTDKSAEQTKLKVLFEDKYLLAIDKPPKIPVHPTTKHLTDNVIIYLESWPRLASIKLRLLHRLDRETSGVLLLSKDYEVHKELYYQFEEKKIYKEYLALVHGNLKNKKGEILAPMKKGDGLIKLKKIIDPDGAQAETYYEVIDDFKKFSLVKIIPKTGKQHQIRLHLSHIGHPIVGDKLYGKDEKYFLKYLEGAKDSEFSRDLLSDRHALHASKLKFFHPVLKKDIIIESKLPKDIKKLVENCNS